MTAAELKRQFNIQVVFDRTLGYVINVLIIFMIIVLVIGLGKTLYTIKPLLAGEELRLNLSHVVPIFCLSS